MIAVIAATVHGVSGRRHRSPAGPGRRAPDNGGGTWLISTRSSTERSWCESCASGSARRRGRSPSSRSSRTEQREAGGGEDAAPRRRRPRYITLRQALAEGRAVITEVSEGGSVPRAAGRQQGRRPHPRARRRGAARRQAEPRAQHRHPHRQAQHAGRAGELHRAGSLVLRLARVRRERDRWRSGRSASR